MTKRRLSSLQARRENEKLHELTVEELNGYWVSDLSQFKDEKWVFPNPTPGARISSSTINWGVELFDGSKLDEPQHVIRRHWARILVLTLVKMPADGRAPAPGTIGNIGRSLKWLLSWMSENGFHHPSELTPQVTEYYIQDLPRCPGAFKNTQLCAFNITQVRRTPLGGGDR